MNSEVSLGVHMVKICLQYRRPRFKPGWRRGWLPTPVFLPGEFHGQWGLVGCSPWGHEELYMTE